MNETATLAKFLSDLKYDDLPTDVVENARLCVLDIIGVAIGSATWPWSKIVLETMVDGSGPQEASVWGQPAKAAARHAALVNGTAAHGIEMDDRVPRSSMHPGCYAVSAALAMTEKQDGSGRDLLTSVVSGYELGLRVGSTMRMRKGVHKSGHKGIWPAVGAAARAANLSQQQTEDAFGLAGSMASGLFRFHQDSLRTMVKRLHGGFAAHNAVLAAELAGNGFDGPGGILEGDYGYIKTYGDDAIPPRWEYLTDGLGNKFRIMDREVKPYAAWGGSHTAIDAVARIHSRQPIAASDVRSVRVGTSHRMIEAHELTEPESVMAAQYSLPFITAVAVARGADSLVDPTAIWTEDTLRDQSIAAVVAKTTLELDSDLEELSVNLRTYGGARVKITTNDGAVYEETVTDSKGTVDNPMSRDEIERKFRLVAGRVIPDRQVDEIIDLCASLDQLDDLHQFGAAIREGT